MGLNDALDWSDCWLPTEAPGGGGSVSPVVEMSYTKTHGDPPNTNVIHFLAQMMSALLAHGWQVVPNGVVPSQAKRIMPYSNIPVLDHADDEAYNSRPKIQLTCNDISAAYGPFVEVGVPRGPGSEYHLIFKYYDPRQYLPPQGCNQLVPVPAGYSYHQTLGNMVNAINLYYAIIFDLFSVRMGQERKVVDAGSGLVGDYTSGYELRYESTGHWNHDDIPLNISCGGADTDPILGGPFQLAYGQVLIESPPTPDGAIARAMFRSVLGSGGWTGPLGAVVCINGVCHQLTPPGLGWEYLVYGSRFQFILWGPKNFKPRYIEGDSAMLYSMLAPDGLMNLLVGQGWDLSSGDADQIEKHMHWESSVCTGQSAALSCTGWGVPQQWTTNRTKPTIFLRGLRGTPMYTLAGQGLWQAAIVGLNFGPNGSMEVMAGGPLWDAIVLSMAMAPSDVGGVINREEAPSIIMTNVTDPSDIQALMAVGIGATGQLTNPELD